MNIFFDLDGTLIDSRKRLYLLFQFLVPESRFSYNEFWNFKRNKVTTREILINQFNFSDYKINSFKERWMEEIELSEWLAFDKPFYGVTEFLVKLRKVHTLFIVTARQSEAKVFEQINQYSWHHIFEKVLVTGQKQEKYNLIINAVDVKKEDWLIGDTGTDIQTGKKLGINTVAVLSGFLNRKSLSAYEPDIIVSDVVELKFSTLFLVNSF